MAPGAKRRRLFLDLPKFVATFFGLFSVFPTYEAEISPKFLLRLAPPKVVTHEHINDFAGVWFEFMRGWPVFFFLCRLKNSLHIAPRTVLSNC